MKRTCAGPNCGRMFDAKRATAKFCSAKCRVAASRVADLPRPASGGATYAATLATLQSAERESSYLGALALTLASRIDETPGSGAAVLAKELRATMDEAMRGVKVAADPLDELKARRDRKLNAG